MNQEEIDKELEEIFQEVMREEVSMEHQIGRHNVERSNREGKVQQMKNDWRISMKSPHYLHEQRPAMDKNKRAEASKRHRDSLKGLFDELADLLELDQHDSKRKILQTAIMQIKLQH